MIAAEDIMSMRFGASSVGYLMVGVKPNLTKKQEELLGDLLVKKDEKGLTDRQTTQLGSLIERRDAKPTLSKTAEKYLNDKIRSLVFKRRKDLFSRALDKGISVESESISLYTRVTGEFFVKNTKKYQNDFFRGIPDCVTEEKVPDIKSSFHFDTFPLLDSKIENLNYFTQLQVYMDMTGLDKAELVYCLVDTPPEIVNKEVTSLKYKLGYIDEAMIPKEIVEETILKHIYTQEGLEDFCLQSAEFELSHFPNFIHIDDKHRVKIFKVEKDNEFLTQLKGQVVLAREYIADKIIEIMK